MKLALIYPPFFASPFNENLPTVDDEFGLFPHLGFGWVARGAAAAGWEVRLWDAAATKQPLDQVIDEVARRNPDAVGFSAHAAQSIRDMLSWAQAFKKRTGLPAIVGGYEAKAYPEEVMSHGCFDFLCGGDAHVALPELLPALERGHGYEKVPELFWLDRGRLRHTFPGPMVPFSEFPTPDRTMFPNHLYYSHVSQRSFFTIGMSQLGCPYSCSFCCIRNSGWQARSAEQVVEEMEECIALGIREIDWFDPLMLHDRQRILDIAGEIKRRKLDIIWSCRARVDSLSFHRSGREPDLELIEALADSGCRRIYVGIESGDNEVLKKMSKDQTVDRNLEKILQALEEAGIMTLGFFILGAPGDTRETVEKTVEYSMTLPLSYAQYQIAIIKPHTELERRHIIEGTGIDYWREYVRGTVDQYLLPTPWTEMSRPELEAIARRAYLRFYTRPGYVMKMLRRVESSAELQRYARVAMQMFLRPLRPGKRPSWLQRASRAGRVFAEATLAVANPGARHPVFKAGGGFREAFRLAIEELRHSNDILQLTPERARAIRKSVESGEGTVPGRYVSFFDQMRNNREKDESVDQD